MPVYRLLTVVMKRLDRFMEADELSPAQRAQLANEQIRALVQLSPMLTLGPMLVSVLLLIMSWPTSAFLPIAIWATVATFVSISTTIVWQRARRGLANGAASSITHAKLAARTLVIGCVWAALVIIAVESGSRELQFAAAVSIAGVLCSTVLAVSAMPVVALAFALPILIAASGAVVFAAAGEANVVMMLVLAFTLTVPVLALSLSRNFARQVVSEALIRHQSEIISLLLKEFEEHSSDWLWEFDRTGRMERVSERFALLADESGEGDGADFCEILRRTTPDNEGAVTDIEHAIAARATFHDIVVKLKRDDAEQWLRLSGKPLIDSTGAYNGYIGMASDTTSERLAERQINFLAHNDALTGLANRGKFTEHLKQSVSRLERYGSPFAVLYMDLDQFKAVNDSFGHMVGDKLLVQVSRRIRSCIRDADIAARLGGDEFAIILSSQFATDHISEIASRLIESVSAPYQFEEGVVSIGVSIGIALAPINGTRPDQILRNADLALYRAKAGGKGTHRFFENQMDSDVRERRMLELELREAVSEGEFVLHYQPLVDADGQRATGFEALIRWNHPIRGIVPPAEFIPIAEQTGLIQQIGDWSIREACNAAVLWPEDMFVAVNLSARHFQMSDIVEIVRDALETSKLAPYRLELEITESLLMDNADDTLVTLSELKALGITVAMDDFGTGYSSLSYLLKFPFDKIKIDKSFVTASSDDVVARDILRSIAALGKTLNMRITAEGVETQEQVEFLSDIACHQLQGFFFAKPLNEADLASYFLNEFARDGREPDEDVRLIA